MKNVGILTLGLKDNYGGILQATALYHFLKDNGYNPILIRKYPIQKKWKIVVSKFLENIPFQNFKNIRLSNIKYKKNLKFFRYNMPNQSPIFYYKKDIEIYSNQNLDAVVVGSDQVWRYAYINDSEYDTYFLNYDLKKEIKKISYAASFGVEYWEAPNLKNDITTFLKKFDAISVREKGGVEICKNFFGVDRVEHVLDPTLLMGEYFFRKIIDNNKITPSKCITYILDENTIKHKLVEKIKIKKSIESHVSLSRNKALSIQEWLNYFAHADVVITDSFHGMVFSILFKKDFYVIINKSRGADRFYSLCDMLEISNRLIDSEDCRIEDFQSLNYENINCKLSALRIKSSSFLLDSLRDVNEFLNK